MTSISLYDLVVFYPNGRGLSKMLEHVMAKYELSEERARTFIENRLNADGGYQDYLHKIIEDYSSMLFRGSPYLDKIIFEIK